MKRFVPQEDANEEVFETPIVDYAERIENPSLEASLIQEKVDMWEPVRKFLERSRRRKWGYEPEDL